MASFIGSQLRFIEAYSDGTGHLCIHMSKLIDHSKFNQENMDLTLRWFFNNPVGKTTNTQTLPTRGAASTQIK
ncbi:hypothetical protein EMCG_06038 [[Emmonsia] crescens]|uniref:Uncharacterized protein n=1 Tax=[Emmonsia] crescens TaxID=73230 RepID=A0A0G2IC87_9EURO|nr:hypothetical protein EMCG_06038 [Emmonsia crescens UAMH 3008]